MWFFFNVLGFRSREVHYRNNFDGKVLVVIDVPDANFCAKMVVVGCLISTLCDLPTLEVFRYLSDRTRTLLTYLGTRILKGSM